MDMKLCYFMIDSNTFLFQVRKYVYHDADNLDTAFDAGGKVSIGLTATTIVSQWTWSATLLQSSTVASKVKITDTEKAHFMLSKVKIQTENTPKIISRRSKMYVLMSNVYPITSNTN